jgi:hypothetical protein
MSRVSAITVRFAEKRGAYSDESAGQSRVRDSTFWQTVPNQVVPQFSETSN